MLHNSMLRYLQSSYAGISHLHILHAHLPVVVRTMYVFKVQSKNFSYYFNVWITFSLSVCVFLCPSLYTSIPTHTHIQYKHTCKNMYVCMHTYIHMYIHTYTHMYMHISCTYKEVAYVK